MINKVQNFWLNRAKLRKQLIKEKQKKLKIPSIYNTKEDDEIEAIINAIQSNNYQI